MRIEKALREKILVMDGSMQEMLYLYGCPASADAPLRCGDVMAGIYSEFLEAGCDILSTYTQGADGASLRKALPGADPREIGLRAASIASEAAQRYPREIFISGDLGQAPLERLRPGTIKAVYYPLVSGLMEGGADMLHLRGFSRPSLARAILNMLSEEGIGLPVVVTVCPKSDPFLPQIKAFWDAVSDYDIMAFGINGFPSKGATDIMRKIASWCPLPLVCCRDVETSVALLSHRERSDRLPRKMHVMAEEGLLNIAGGGKGTLPGHICGLLTALEGTSPRII